jgi:hypothetical protein
MRMEALAQTAKLVPTTLYETARNKSLTCRCEQLGFERLANEELSIAPQFQHKQGR